MPEPATRRLAGCAPPLRAVPAVAVMLLAAGCGSTPEPEYAGICVDPVTQVRLDDGRCGTPDEYGNGSLFGGYFFWISTRYRGTVPAVGHHASTTPGTRTVSRGSVLATGVPRAGGSMQAIVRGGLGHTGGKSGGS
ncbi:hypothetical protein ACFPM7_06635 [Actinokineospora guangxiensis]|uniref:Peptidase inhibitor family I36 n=1 Tax=Actinokineospora guangxiensis TaxID=1490288 RepID=A0ABW0EH53_9PSEU